MPEDLTQEELVSALDYNPETGLFTAKKTRANLVAGKIAGYLHKPSGYWLIMINYRKYKAHRLAWLYVTGRWPDDQIDHIDQDRANNVFNNLRECTNSQNAMNSRRRRDNTSGYRGVYLYKRINKWVPYIRINGRMKCFGHFNDIESAIAVRRAKEIEHYGNFSPLAQERRTPNIIENQ